MTTGPLPRPKPRQTLTKRQKWIRLAVIILVFFVFPILAIWWVVCQPSLRSNTPSRVSADPARLEASVRLISESHSPRSFGHRDNLERIADFIAHEFSQSGGQVERQKFRHSGLYEFQNVIGRFGPADPSLPRIVVGAHYDAYGEFPGADDNASGVAGVVELARLLSSTDPGSFALPIELVCWPLEEPPYFRTDAMGSAAHARWLQESGARIRLMISLEMIGYFSDSSGSQTYPNFLLSLFYPDRANFVAVVGNLRNRPSVALAKATMRGATPLPVHSIAAPPNVPGIDFSDHINFWKQGYPAIMITDTAFYRNDRYHTSRDTADTLDYTRMSQVVVGTFEVILALADGG